MHCVLFTEGDVIVAILTKYIKKLQIFLLFFLKWNRMFIMDLADSLASKACTQCCHDTVHLLGGRTKLLWSYSDLWQLIIIFLACDLNCNGYAASASIIFINHVLGNTVSMSWYVLVLCIVISQYLHSALVFYFRDPFPFFPLFFIKPKRFNHCCFESYMFKTRVT